MKKLEVDQLFCESMKYVNKEVTLVVRNYKGKNEERRFAFVASKVIGFGNIQEPGESHREEDMFYHVTAILHEVNGNAVLDILPLRVVIEALRDNSTIRYEGTIY